MATKKTASEAPEQEPVSAPEPPLAIGEPGEEGEGKEEAPTPLTRGVKKPSEMEAWQAGVAVSAAAEAEAAKVVAAKVAAPPKAPKKRGKPAWRETRWGTHPNYECKFCHYSTLDLKAMAAHADANHPEEES